MYRKTETRTWAQAFHAHRDHPTATTSDNLVHVSLLMPCLNEAATLPQCIEEGQQALAQLSAIDGLTGEILVADNGSSDGSVELSQTLGARVVQIAQKGYGNALIGGVAAARGQYIVMADADASYDLREAAPMVRKLREGFDLCMGSRFKGTILPGAMPAKNRYIGNPLLTGVLNLLFRSGLSDAHCGMRAFTKDAFAAMHLTSSGMEFASEMVIKATLLDLKRCEVPVTLRPDGRDRPPHLRPWRDGWRHLRYILMLSPFGLYFVPALIFGFLGLLILLLLLINRSDLVVAVGPIWFGDHWLIIASAMIVASEQAIIFGLATTLYGVRSGYRKAPAWLVRVSPYLRLETLLLVSAALLVVAMVWFLVIFASWSRSGFGSLDKLRELVGVTTLGLLSVQTFFGGYLLAIINGNEVEIHRSFDSAP